MSTHPSLTKTKTSFLRSQIRLLSSPLSPPTQPSPSSSSSSEIPPIPEKTLTDLTTKVNAKIKSHNRLVFSGPSQRHVAEQIDTLYWNEVVASHRAHGEGGVVWIAKDTQFDSADGVGGLPGGLGEVCDGDVGEGEEVRYTELKGRVEGLVERRNEVRKRVEGLRRLRGLVGAFEDVRGVVQPNLVTREGELAREVERMRVLVARVQGGMGRLEEEGNGGGGGGGGVGGSREGEEGGEEAGRSVVLSGQQKLARVMDLW